MKKVAEKTEFHPVTHSHLSVVLSDLLILCDKVRIDEALFDKIANKKPQNDPSCSYINENQMIHGGEEVKKSISVFLQFNRKRWVKRTTGYGVGSIHTKFSGKVFCVHIFGVFYLKQKESSDEKDLNGA